MVKTAICIIQRNLAIEWVKFLNEFKNYDTYIVSDNSLPNNLEKIKKEFPNVNLITIDNKSCEEAGITNINALNFQIKITAWEKAVYYFLIVNKNYNNIWFIEDDVFFYDEDVISNIDKKYTEEDLLTNTLTEVLNPNIDGWHWDHLKIEYPPIYGRAMSCAARVSSRLLSKILEYANEYKSLYFIEALFATTCVKNKEFKHSTPEELKTIDFRYYKPNVDHNNWEEEMIKERKNNLFHPVKNLELHSIFRNNLNIKN
jgi:hypothetical protein